LVAGVGLDPKDAGSWDLSRNAGNGAVFWGQAS